MRNATLAWACVAVAIIGWRAEPGPARAQPYPTMAAEPDPAAFVKRVDTNLTLLGTNLRFAGANIAWLGLRRDGDGPARRPTQYEVKDVVATVSAIGGSVIRATSAAGTAGCALCLEPAPRRFSPDAFAALDRLIKLAGDSGMKLILPLAGTGGPCDTRAGPGAEDAEASSICAYGRWHGIADSRAFFTDPALRAEFLAHVAAVVTHVNALTGVAYRDDPAILAWENCDACGEGADPQAVADWVEVVGRVVKANDHHHLYEDGAFAGHILPDAPRAVAAAAFAPPSVDIVGDAALPTADHFGVRRILAAAVGAVSDANRVYVLDRFGWSPRLWPSEAAFEDFLEAMVRQRNFAGALLDGLQGHADQGGYLPPPPASEDGQFAAFAFPGMATQDVGLDEMKSRGRAIRRFEFAIVGVPYAPTYQQPPQPEIIAVRAHRVLFRGAAGALSYSIERSPDPSIPNSFTLVCERCIAGTSASWEDPSPPAGPAWYRVIPNNINDHAAPPSDPVENK